MTQDYTTKINSLPLWSRPITISPLAGGRTNKNFVVSDQRASYVVRFGGDIPEHHVMRFNELAASRAAHAAGLSPAVLYAETGVTVIEHINSKTLCEQDVATPQYLPRIVSLMRRCHHDIPRYYRGPALMFWVFHVIRDYGATLRAHNSPYLLQTDEFINISNALAEKIGPVDIVFGHNDLMAANILDDGARLWLIDWDYAGFNTPLFDLGGLASNNEFTPAQESTLLETYYETPITDALLHRYHAMKCASLLRETMWSMVSEQTSKLEDVDYAAYTAENLKRFEQAYAIYKQM